MVEPEWNEVRGICVCLGGEIYGYNKNFDFYLEMEAICEFWAEERPDLIWLIEQIIWLLCWKQILGSKGRS